MAESVGTRVRRLVSGGINALIDAVEGSAPEVVMDQTLREIDLAIAEVRNALGEALAGRHRATRRHAAENAELQQLEERLQVALSEGRDELAEAAVARQLDIEAQLPVLEAAISEGAEREAELERYIAALQARKRELATELEHYRDARSAAGSSSDRPVAGAASRAERAESAFQRAMGATGSVLPRSDDPARAARLVELEELTRRNRIRERLEAIRARRES